MPSILDSKAAQPELPATHWYALVGIAAGCIAFLVGMTVVAYRCYRQRIIQRGFDDDPELQGTLSSAIKKGLSESFSAGSIKKSGSGQSIGSNHSIRSISSTGGVTYVKGNKQNENNNTAPARRISKSSSGGSNVDSGQLQTENNVEGETEDMPCTPETVGSPIEKDELSKETAVDELKIPKLGNLHFNVVYDHQKTALVVTVAKADELPIKDQTMGSSDPYVKLQLLPEKRHKVKTRVLRKTLNPSFDETFTFYGINVNQLASITLHFVILSFDRFSRDDVIGEVVYPLEGVELTEKEVNISREIAPRLIKMHSHGRGELLVSLCYQPAANRLTVVVLKARNLPKMDITGLADPYVKIYLLYNGQRIAKKKTHVKKRTLNPVFNESFLFDVPCNEGLQNISLEFAILDWDRVTKNDIIGRLEVGAKLGGQEGHHWSEVMNCPRKQIAVWHKLKE